MEKIQYYGYSEWITTCFFRNRRLNVVVHPGTWAVEAGGFSSSLKLVWST